jgi:signal transduction histidine kinase
VEEISVQVADAMEAAAQHALFLADVSGRLASSLNYETTLTAIPQLMVPLVADWCALDMLDESASIQRVASAHINPTREAIGDEISQRYPPDPMSAYDAPHVLRTESPSLVTEFNDELLMKRAVDAEHMELLRKFGALSEMIVPLIARGRTLGALTLATADSRRRYGQNDLLLAQELAGRSALALDNARLYSLARQAVQLRDQFLASVSHDLKSPLATIRGQAQLLRRAARLKRAGGSPSVDEGLARIEVTVDRMGSMIDELLDVARLELGRPLELARRRMDLVALARQVVSDHQQQSQRHIIQLAGESELIGEWDPQRLQRVLDNLLSNALKYSPEGGMVTVAIVRDEDDAGASAILSVRDQGVGIPTADLPRIFEAFQRAQNVARIGGSGVGLAVALQIVAQHGGTLTVDSREGYGSTFTVRLPIR